MTGRFDRGRRAYTFDSHAPNHNAERGVFLFKADANIDEYRPSYTGGTTVFRPLPVWNPEFTPGVKHDGKYMWDPYRFPTGDDVTHPGGFADWVRCYDVVTVGTTSRATFIVPPPKELTDQVVSPVSIMYTALAAAVKAGQEQPGWATLMDGGQNQRAALERPSRRLFFQALLCKLGEKQFNPPKGLMPDNKLVVMSAPAKSVIEALSERTPEGAAGAVHPDDWERYYTAGDPVGWNNGRFLVMYKLSDGDPRQTPQATGGWNTSQAGQQRGGGTLMGFGCFAMPEYAGVPASAVAAYEETLASKIRPWDDILHMPTVEEQAAMVATRLPASAVMYGFREHPEWIPDSVRQAAVAQVSVVPGWGGPPPGAPTVAWGAPVPGMPTGGPSVGWTGQHPVTVGGPAAGWTGQHPVPVGGPPVVGAPVVGAPVVGAPADGALSSPPAFGLPSAPSPAFGLPPTMPVAASAAPTGWGNIAGAMMGQPAAASPLTPVAALPSPPQMPPAVPAPAVAPPVATTPSAALVLPTAAASPVIGVSPIPGAPEPPPFAIPAAPGAPAAPAQPMMNRALELLNQARAST